MNIFNSLGSNYNFSFVLKSLFNFGGDGDHLKKILEEKYGKKATLLYKGREALELALISLNLQGDSFVAINGFTCFAVFEAIKNANLNCEYLDIAGGELNFSASELESHLEKNPKIKVVVVQNTLGYPCDGPQIAKICHDKKIVLIEDLAHSIGTKYKNGQEAGTIGDITFLSFSQDKIIDSISGGALINVDTENPTQNIPIKKQLMDKFYPLITYIIRNTYPLKIGKIIHKVFKSLKLLSEPMDKQQGLYSLSNWYIKITSEAFNKLAENLSHRKKIAEVYVKNINPKILSPKIVDSINLSSNLRFPIFVNKREKLIEYLKGFEVYVSDIWYDAPIAPKKYLSLTDYKNQCPNAELAAEEILNLPTHINISPTDALEISNLINQWLKLQ